MSQIELELRGLIESPFSKEKIELVLNGTADSSGLPVQQRLRDVQEEHYMLKEIGVEDGREGGYRLVSVKTLYDALAAIERLRDVNREQMATLADAFSDPDGFKESVQRTRDLLQQAGADIGRQPPEV